MARMSRLAIFGGKPVRTEPYPPHNTMIGEEEEREVLEVLRSGNLSGFSATSGERFLGGPKVLALEAAFAENFGVKYAVATNSATSALHCAIAALGIGPGDEVITSPFTMCATAAAIVSNGATPVFADIETETFGLDPVSVRSCVTPKTKSILTVNLFGHPCRLEEIKATAQKMALRMVEDNAQSPLSECQGVLSGTWGDIGVQSLNCHKVIQAGEGGIAITNNPHYVKPMQLIRNHAEAMDGYYFGSNYRMTELTAAVAMAQLRKIERLIGARKRLASLMTEALAPFDFLQPPAVRHGCSHVFYLYPILFRADLFGAHRYFFHRAMKAEGVSIQEGYTTPTHMLPYYRARYAHHELRCSVASDMFTNRLLTTDICKYPNTEREVEQFAEAVKKIADNIWELRGHA